MHELVTIRSDRVQIPHPTDRVHLQFAIRLRDAPSVTCIARSIVQRYHELVAVGIREVVVFHSSVAEMQPYQGDLPFAAIADPEKRLYAEFGVESSLRAVLSANALGAAIRGAITRRSSKPKGEKGLGLPADFLIAPDGECLPASTGFTPTTNGQWTTSSCSLTCPMAHLWQLSLLVFIGLPFFFLVLKPILFGTAHAMNQPQDSQPQHEQPLYYQPSQQEQPDYQPYTQGYGA